MSFSMSTDAWRAEESITASCSASLTQWEIAAASQDVGARCVRCKLGDAGSGEWFSQCTSVLCNATGYSGMQCSAIHTIQYSMVQFIAMQYSTIRKTQCNTIQCYTKMQFNVILQEALQYSTKWETQCNAIQCENAIQYNTIIHKAVQYSTVWETMQYKTMQCNTKVQCITI